MNQITMLQGEEIYRTCPFASWLVALETVTGGSVAVTDNATATDVSATFTASAAPGADDTSVVYLLKAPTVGDYSVKVTATTSSGQKLAHAYLLQIKL